MSLRIDTLATQIDARFGATAQRIASICNELTYAIPAAHVLSICHALRTEPEFKFEQLIDLTAVDYLTYQQSEWNTFKSTATGFSRSVHAATANPDPAAAHSQRFAIVYHLLSIKHNVRLRLRAFCPDNEMPVIDSVNTIWAAANWYEREAFDLFGVLFQGHPDLRRLLTDYGFIGHPFRKDFPLIGNVEVRYDSEKGRVVYQPVSIEPRTLVPRVIREDNRYAPALKNTVTKTDRH